MSPGLISTSQSVLTTFQSLREANLLLKRLKCTLTKSEVTVFFTRNGNL